MSHVCLSVGVDVRTVVGLVIFKSDKSVEHGPDEADYQNENS